MNQKIHDKMMLLVEKAGRDGLSSNVPFSEAQFSELVKLRQLSILQSAYRTHATEINLPVLAREDFTKDLVDIAYSYAGINKHRQKKHSYEFFRDNIAVYDGNHLEFTSGQIDPENMLHAFSTERIYAQRSYKLEGLDTFAIFRDVKKKHEEQAALEQQHRLFQNDLIELGLAERPQLNIINPQIMELLKIQQQLIQQALEQQKLSLLSAHPELMTQQLANTAAKQIDSLPVQQLISRKLNERNRD